MSMFVLTSRLSPSRQILINSADLEPGELAVLKRLNNCAHFSFERLVEDRLPPMEHDGLDDIAKEIVAGPKPNYEMGDSIYAQAQRRVAGMKPR